MSDFAAHIPPWPPVDLDVQDALNRIYTDGTYGQYLGPETDALSAELAAYHAVQHVRLCCSGTSAVLLALVGLGVAPGDEVLLAGYDFPGNFRAIEVLGAVPSLVDVSPHDWQLDVDRLDEALTPRTKALVASHLHGGLIDMRRLRDWATANGIMLVEDACQVPGAMVQGQRAGTHGDAGVLSFGGSKLLSAGRGGGVLTSKPEVAQRMKVYAEQGNDLFPLSQLQAAVLRPQLAKLDVRNAQRLQAVQRISHQIADSRSLRPLVSRTAGIPAYYKLALMTPSEDQRDALVAAAKRDGIPLAAGFSGLAKRSQRRCVKVPNLTVSQQAAERCVVLHHPILLAENAIVDQLADWLAKEPW